MKLYFYSKQMKAHGVSVIVDHFIEACKRASVECSFIGSLDREFSQEELIVSYGVKEAYEAMVSSNREDIAFLADAVSLGYRNKILFYLKHAHVFQYDFFYSIYAYLKFVRQEIKVCKKYRRIVLVSKIDTDYLINLSRQPRNKFFYVTNGVYIPHEIKPKSISSQFRLGLLASWGARQTYAESAWFVKDYFLRYHRKHPEVILKLVGRGSFIRRLEGLPGVEVLGAVDSLNDTFSNIDLFIGANPKGCGILNRCLDAMSLKTPILSLPECFTGIPNSEGLYYKYTDYKSFEEQLDYLRSNYDETDIVVNRAYDYVLKNNDWKKNYDLLIQQLDIV